MPAVNVRGESTAGPGRSRWGTSPALVLLVLLSCWWPTVDAAYDPMVEAVQEALTERGFKPGTIDGAMGSRTRRALKEFQTSVGLPPTGEINAATRSALGLDRSDPDPTPSPAASPPTPAGSGTAAQADPSGAERLRAAPQVEPAPAEPPRAAPQAEPTPAEPPCVAPQAEPARAEPPRAAPQADPARAEPPRAAPQADPARAEPPRAAPQADPARAEPPRAAPQADPARAEPPRAAPAPKPLLRFSTLGWHPPGTGTEALKRFVAIGAPRDFRHGSDPLFVPKAELVFVLHAGERVPGLDCDPGAGRLAVEFVFGPDGPVIFTPAAGGALCQMGIGIALEVGRTLEMRPVDWGGVQYPRGSVRVTGEGLQYID